MCRRFYSLIIIIITMFLCSACYEVIETTTYYDPQPVSYNTYYYPYYDYYYPAGSYYYY